jgi:hypothetical protein
VFCDLAIGFIRRGASFPETVARSDYIGIREQLPNSTGGERRKNDE